MSLKVELRSLKNEKRLNEVEPLLQALRETVDSIHSALKDSSRIKEMLSDSALKALGIEAEAEELGMPKTAKRS